MGHNSLKKILIVGATGFVGPALVEEFSRAGYTVVCGVRNMNSASRQLQFKNVEFMQVNLNDDLDPNIWLERLEEFQIDGVVNNVGIANAFGGQSLEKVNVLAPFALFKAVCSYNSQSRQGKRDVHVIQISTTGANWPDCEEYEYPRTKKKIDDLLFSLNELSFTIVRPNVIYEPARGHLLLAQIARLPVIAYVGKSDIQPIHCRELAIGIVRLMEHPQRAKSTILQATGPEVLTWKQILKRVTKALDRDHCIMFPMPLLVGQVFTNLIQRLPEKILYRLGILSKLDNDTIEMMTKGSIGDNSEWLKHTRLHPIYVYDTYKNFCICDEAYTEYIQMIRDEEIIYSKDFKEMSN